MKKARLVFLVLLLLAFNTFQVFATPIDVQYHWAGTEINTLIENNILNGYSDGRFKPSRKVTREEMYVALVSVGVEKGMISRDELLIASFTSLPAVHNRWSEKEMKYLYRYNIIDSDSDGTLKPESYISRGALAYLLYNYYTHFNLFQELINTTSCPFTDITDHYAKVPIIKMYQADILSGYSDSTFHPDDFVSRAEMAVILYRISSLSPIEPTITLPKYNVIDVPYISQVYPLYAPVGCEGTSLLMGLHAKGYALNTNLKQFLDDMPKHESNPAKGFVGSPYQADKTKKTRTTIYPAILASWSSKYGYVSDISGSSTQEIQAELLAGNPVVIYATLWWGKPFYRTYNIEGEKQKLLSNNHAVLACGYSASNNSYFIADPYNVSNPHSEYKYWIDGTTFENIYNVRKHAVVIR